MLILDLFAVQNFNLAPFWEGAGDFIGRARPYQGYR